MQQNQNVWGASERSWKHQQFTADSGQVHRSAEEPESQVLALADGEPQFTRFCSHNRVWSSKDEELRAVSREQADPALPGHVLRARTGLHDRQHQPVRLDIRRNPPCDEVLCGGQAGLGSITDVITRVWNLTFTHWPIWLLNGYLFAGQIHKFTDHVN